MMSFNNNYFLFWHDYFVHFIFSFIAFTREAVAPTIFIIPFYLSACTILITDH